MPAITSIIFTTPQDTTIRWSGGTVRYSHHVSNTMTEIYTFEDFYVTRSNDVASKLVKRGIVMFDSFVLLFAIADEVYLLPEKVKEVACFQAQGWRLDDYRCDCVQARAWFADDDVHRINAFSLATKWALEGTEYKAPGLTTR
jgi:hypothetical protein